MRKLETKERIRMKDWIAGKCDEGEDNKFRKEDNRIGLQESAI